MRFIFFILSAASFGIASSFISAGACRRTTTTLNMLCAGPPPPPPLAAAPPQTHPITPSGKTIKVLINDGDGYFRFSFAFLDEFERTYNYSVDSIGVFQSFGFFSNNDPKYIKWRYDDRIINVVEKFGEKKSSGTYDRAYSNCFIKMVELPEEVAPYIMIDNYDGGEKIVVNTGAMYKELLTSILESRGLHYYDLLRFEYIRNLEAMLKSCGVFCV